MDHGAMDKEGQDQNASKRACIHPALLSTANPFAKTLKSSFFQPWLKQLHRHQPLAVQAGLETEDTPNDMGLDLLKS
jgi:hypothetical protein